MADIIVDGKDAGEVFKSMWTAVKRTFISGIAEMLIEMVFFVVKSIAIQLGMLPPLIAMGEAIALAWASAAAMVSLATLGGNAIPAAAGIGAVTAFAKGIATLQEGGIVPGIGKGDKVPALLEPGELVIPRDQVGGATNNNFGGTTVNVSLAGAFILDDPVQVQRLYRDHLRDVIQDDIRTRRDVHFG